jgi:hypothetical protein
MIERDPAVRRRGHGDPAPRLLRRVEGARDREAVGRHLHRARLVVGGVGFLGLVGARPGRPEPVPAHQLPLAAEVFARFPEQQVVAARPAPESYPRPLGREGDDPQRGRAQLDGVEPVKFYPLDDRLGLHGASRTFAAQPPSRK